MPLVYIYIYTQAFVYQQVRVPAIIMKDINFVTVSRESGRVYTATDSEV